MTEEEEYKLCEDICQHRVWFAWVLGLISGTISAILWIQ